MGLDPMEIVMIRQAVEKGLAKPDELKLVGAPVPEGLTPFKKPDSISLDFTGNVPGFLPETLRLRGLPPPQILPPGESQTLCGLRKMRRELPRRHHPHRKQKSEIPKKRLHLLLLLPGNVPEKGDLCAKSAVKREKCLVSPAKCYIDMSLNNTYNTFKKNGKRSFVNACGRGEKVKRDPLYLKIYNDLLPESKTVLMLREAGSHRRRNCPVTMM